MKHIAIEVYLVTMAKKVRISAYLQNSEEVTSCEVETWKTENMMTQQNLR